MTPEEAGRGGAEWLAAGRRGGMCRCSSRPAPPARASTSSRPSCSGACRSPSRSRWTAADELAEYRVYRPAAAREFEVERLGPGEFRVTGEVVERLIARHDLENEEALAHVERRLHRLGVITRAGERGLRPRRRRRDRRRGLRAGPRRAAVAAARLRSPADLDRHDGAGAPGRLPPDHPPPPRSGARGGGDGARLRAEHPAARADGDGRTRRSAPATAARRGRQGARARGPHVRDAALRLRPALRPRRRPRLQRPRARRRLACGSPRSTRSTTSSPSSSTTSAAGSRAA